MIESINKSDVVKKVQKVKKVKKLQQLFLFLMLLISWYSTVQVEEAFVNEIKRTTLNFV